MVFVYAYIALAVLATLFVLASCILSGRISQQEEQEELRVYPIQDRDSSQWEISPKQRPIF